MYAVKNYLQLQKTSTDNKISSSSSTFLPTNDCQFAPINANHMEAHGTSAIKAASILVGSYEINICTYNVCYHPLTAGGVDDTIAK